MQRTPQRTPCSTPPACRASPRSGPSTSRRPSMRCSTTPTPRWHRPPATPCRPTTTRSRPCSTWPTSGLSRAWGAVGHLNAVADTPELRAAYNENMPKVVDFQTRVGADEALVRQVQGRARQRALGPPDAPRAARPWATRCATSSCRAPSCRAPPRRASPNCRTGRPSSARSFPSTCSTRPTATPVSLATTNWRACPTT